VPTACAFERHKSTSARRYQRTIALNTPWIGYK
jgi:hypothetical protein